MTLRVIEVIGGKMEATDKPAPAPGQVKGVGPWAVGNVDGDLFAVSRRCRHLGADLAKGSIDSNGCLVCPWHGARYDVKTGEMVRGPQGIFAKIPGLSEAFKLLTKVVPLRRTQVRAQDNELIIGSAKAPE